MSQNKSFIERILAKPYVIISFLALFMVSGIVGYQTIHRNLFPNSNYPEVAVVVVEPGASAKSIASNVAVPVEEELYTLDEIRRVYSTTIDEVTVIKAEFEYAKDIDTAVSDVSNAINKIRAKLPNDIKSPQIIKITQATAPILVVALSPKNNSLSLEDIRDLASGKLKHQLLKTPGVANVDIFGGYEKELEIILDKKRLDSLGVSMAEVIAIIKKSNSDVALGFLENSKNRYLIGYYGKKDDISKIKNIQIRPNIKLGDIAKVYFGHYDNSAIYFGNTKPAIALSIQRSLSADVLKTAKNVREKIEEFKEKYPNISFEISDTQEDTIKQSITNMFESLRDAILMSTIVVFIFLASFRQIVVVLFTIPLVYASTIALMWVVGIEFNVVTLTAIILALGLLLDDTVVVMENIERHYKELKKPIKSAVYDGTKEIMFADLSGTLTTMVALAPMLFVGGYPQTIFAPLVGTLLLALLASYVISIIAVPLLSLHILAMDYAWLLKLERAFGLIIDKLNDYMQSFFASTVKIIISSKIITLFSFLVLFALFGISAKKVMPVVGQELMPPMDTGAVNIKITVDENLPIKATEEVLQKANKIIKDEAKLLRVSSSVGSEAGVLSIGSGAGIDHIFIVATYVDRFHRKKDIWEISASLREKLSKVPNIKYLEVAPYGSTAMSSIRANVDTLISGENLNTLLKTAKDVQEALNQTKGVVSTSITWDLDKIVYDLKIDDLQLANYKLSKAALLSQLQIALRGAIVGSFPRDDAQDYRIRVWLKKNQINSIEKLESFLINTPKGKVPLSQFAKISIRKEPSLITRDGLAYTIEVYGNRDKAAISHIMADYESHLKKIKIPPDVEIRQIGDENQFKASASRMIKGILVAIFMIFLTLILLFGSIKISLMILFSIPLTLIGASWTLLYLNYHISMPAMMGFILLSGIIVNNAILLIHFALEQIEKGIDKTQAMIEAIKIRTRPVLMTAFSVSAGMLPVALGSAIGLERLAPLGAVAIGGLIIGTLMTLIFIPIVFIKTYKE
jgi:multidrug efflux pump subunit AcrB